MRSTVVLCSRFWRRGKATPNRDFPNSVGLMRGEVRVLRTLKRDQECSDSTTTKTSTSHAHTFCMYRLGRNDSCSIIQRIGVVPMSIAGIAKEVATITVSAWVFGDELTPLNITGVSIAISGAFVFSWMTQVRSYQCFCLRCIRSESSRLRGDPGDVDHFSLLVHPLFLTC